MFLVFNFTLTVRLSGATLGKSKPEITLMLKNSFCIVVLKNSYKTVNYKSDDFNSAVDKLNVTDGRTHGRTHGRTTRKHIYYRWRRHKNGSRRFCFKRWHNFLAEAYLRPWSEPTPEAPQVEVVFGVRGFLGDAAPCRSPLIQYGHLAAADSIVRPD